MANNSTSAIIVVVVAICMVAVTVPALIVATQDDSSGTTVVTIVSDPDSEEVDWHRVLEVLNGSGLEYLSAKEKDTGDGIICTVTGNMTAFDFDIDVSAVLAESFDPTSHFGPKNNSIIEEGAPLSNYPVWWIKITS